MSLPHDASPEALAAAVPDVASNAVVTVSWCRGNDAGSGSDAPATTAAGDAAATSTSPTTDAASRTSDADACACVDGSTVTERAGSACAGPSDAVTGSTVGAPRVYVRVECNMGKMVAEDVAMQPCAAGSGKEAVTLFRCLRHLPDGTSLVACHVRHMGCGGQYGRHRCICLHICVCRSGLLSSMVCVWCSLTSRRPAGRIRFVCS